MIDNTAILQEEFNKLRLEMIEAYDRKGMRASGKFADELEAKVSPNNAILFGEHYAQQLETGRKAGKFPPIKAIEQWIYDKGLDQTIDGNITVKSLAFLIARKISRHGWDRDGDVNLISEVITEKRIDQIIKRVGEYTVLELTTDIIKMIENVKSN